MVVTGLDPRLDEVHHPSIAFRSNPSVLRPRASSSTWPCSSLPARESSARRRPRPTIARAAAAPRSSARPAVRRRGRSRWSTSLAARHTTHVRSPSRGFTISRTCAGTPVVQGRSAKTVVPATYCGGPSSQWTWSQDVPRAQNYVVGKGAEGVDLGPGPVSVADVSAAAQLVGWHAVEVGATRVDPCRSCFKSTAGHLRPVRCLSGSGIWTQSDVEAPCVPLGCVS